MKIKYLYATLIYVATISCGSEPAVKNDSVFGDEGENKSQVDSDSLLQIQAKQVKDFKNASKVFYALPSPIEMADILKKSNVVYDPEILNDPNKTSSYITSTSKAIALGLYFADLSFSSVFDQVQESKNYIKAAHVISNDLNIVDIFTERVVVRMEENMNNKDSILTIISETYMNTEDYLEKDNRPVIASAILTGAWIEGLYIATNLRSKEGESKIIKTKIGEQKSSLENLIKLLANNDDEDLAEVKSELDALKLLYDQVEIDQQGETVVETNTETNTSVIGTEINYEMSDEVFNEIKETIQNIRANLAD